ncbi:MerR family transcriptional regulator [Kitasatospora sp. NPDC048365]|uniref:MerR family transcriptional regulator n=1 Tax=Kitasatospora sp. NPDC048365 TaxID=3364050 RepID=UPI003713711C
MRPVDLAREHGLSTQAVRNYEDAGILPPAERSAHGYRRYGPRHAAALRTFLALVPAHGHATATAVMRALNAGELAEALRLIDGSHEQLAVDRRTLDEVEAAVGHLVEADPGGAAETFIGPLARRLGVRAATLRAWERAGLVVPARDRRTGYRVYAPADVRDVLLAHQLRRGGYGLEQIARVLERVRAAGGTEPLRAALEGRRERVTARGRAMLAAAAAVDGYLRRHPG